MRGKQKKESKRRKIKKGWKENDAFARACMHAFEASFSRLKSGRQVEGRGRNNYSLPSYIAIRAASGDRRICPQIWYIHVRLPLRQKIQR